MTTNAAPPTPFMVDEGAALSTNVSSWFEDDDENLPGAPAMLLAYTGTLQKTGGDSGDLPSWLVLNRSTGALTIEAAAEGTSASLVTDDAEVGVYTLTVTATDETYGTTHTITHTVGLEIQNVDEAPVTTKDAMTALEAAEGMMFNLDISGWFRDPDSGDAAPTLRLVDNPTWLTLDGSMLTIAAGMTDDAQVATHNFTIVASDVSDSNLATTLEVALTIDNINDAPTVKGTPTRQLTAAEGASFSQAVSGWFTDPDADDTSLTYTATLKAGGAALPGWLKLDNGVLTISESATDDTHVGMHTIVITASDGEATATHEVTLSITNVNDAPTTTGAAMASLTAAEGASFSQAVSGWFTDTDADDTSLIYTATLKAGGAALPTWLKLDDGVLTITESVTDDTHVGMYTIVVAASDGEATATHEVTLTITNVNDAPTVKGTPTRQLTAAEGATTMWDVSGWFTDTDADDTSLTYTATLKAGGAALPTWLELNSGNLTIAATTDDTHVGMHTLVVAASDGEATATHEVTLTITNVNDAPTVKGTPTRQLTAAEGATTMWDVSGWFTDSDADDTSLTYTATLKAGGALPAWLKLDDGILGLAVGVTTDDTHVGMHTIVVTASDDESTPATVTHEVTLSITNVPEPPTTTTAADASITVAEGVALNEAVSSWFTDPDPKDEGGALTYTAANLPAGDWLSLTDGVLTIEGGATNDAQVGPYVFEVTASDSVDGTDDAVRTVSLTVMNVDEAPTLTDASLLVQSVAEGATLSLDVMTWFKDPDLTDGSFTVMVSDRPGFLTQDGNTGMLTIAAGATDDAQVGTHTFKVTAADSSMPSLTTVVNVELTIENTPEPPVVVTTGEMPALAMLTAMEGSMFSVDVSDWFTDPDHECPGHP